MPKEQANAFKAGIFVILGAIIIGLLIVALGQRTQLFTPQFHLSATFQNAGGLITGGVVRIAGVNAGTVSRIRIFRTPEEMGMVRVEMRVGMAFRDSIRRDSVAYVRSLGILGDKYVEISIGSAEEPALESGATIPSEESVDFYQVADEARETFKRANMIAKEIGDVFLQLDKAAFVTRLDEAAQSLSKLLARAEKGPSLLHSLVYDEEMTRMLEDIRAASASLRATAEKIHSGEGSLGNLIYGDELSRAVKDFNATLASAREIMTEVRSGNGAAHALIYDPHERQALAELGSAIQKLNTILAEIRDGHGTLGLLISDPSVWEGLQRLLGNAEDSKVLKLFIDRGPR